MDDAYLVMYQPPYLISWQIYTRIDMDTALSHANLSRSTSTPLVHDHMYGKPQKCPKTSNRPGKGQRTLK